MSYILVYFCKFWHWWSDFSIRWKLELSSSYTKLKGEKKNLLEIRYFFLCCLTSEITNQDSSILFLCRRESHMDEANKATHFPISEIFTLVTVSDCRKNIAIKLQDETASNMQNMKKVFSLSILPIAALQYDCSSFPICNQNLQVSCKWPSDS